MEEDGCIQVKKSSKNEYSVILYSSEADGKSVFSGASLQNSFAAFSYTPEGAADLFKNV